MNGFSSNNNSMTGTENKNIDTIYNRSLITTSITSDFYNGIPKQDILYLSGLNANVQQQINALSSNINSGGGGAFLLYGESAVGFDPMNNYGRHWVHGSGVVGYIGITVPTSTLIGISIQASSWASSMATVVIEKNVGGQYSNAVITLATNQSSNIVTGLNAAFSIGDTCTFRTLSGSGGGLIRMTAIFNTVGVIGPTGLTPNLTIGTVTNLLPGSDSTATISGTTSNPILNLSLVRGYDGVTPNFTIGSVSSLSYGSNPTVNITGTSSSPILNFGLVRGQNGSNGITPSISIGNVTAYAYGTYPTATITGSIDNLLLNLGLEQGAPGITPSFTIGSVSSLSYGSTPTVILSGTSSSPILNFGLVRGINGITPNLSIGNVTAYAYGTYPTATITGSIDNLLLNLGLEQGSPGITPSFSIGNVVTVPYGLNSSVSITGTSTNPILNFRVPQGPQGYIGSTPTITIGTITQIYYNDNSPATVELDPLSTAANPILNFSLKQGIQGPQGNKGDKGDKGDSVKGDDGDDVDYGKVGGMIAGAILIEAGVTATLLAAALTAQTTATALAIASAKTSVETQITATNSRVTSLETASNSYGFSITALETKTQNQSATIGSTIFNGNMTIGTVFTSNTTIHGLSTTIYGDLILPGITVDDINVRNSITTNQTNITNLQTKTSNMTAINGISTTFTDDLILYNLLTGSVNIGATLTALRDVTSNITTVPNVSTNFSGIVYLGGTLNLRSTIDQNVADIINLQQALTTANTDISGLKFQVQTLTTTTNHQASHITSLQNQIEILNDQFDTMNFSNGFMDQISNNPFDNPFIDLFHD